MEPFRLYLDTEFNAFRGPLISMALVSAVGDVFYEVVECPGPIDPWVAEHVMPKLEKAAIPIEEFQKRLQAFLLNLPPLPPTVEIVADWPDDIKHFCEALITGPGMCLKWGRTLGFALVDLPDFSSADESKLPHNALADAQALMRYCTDPAYLPGWGMT